MSKNHQHNQSNQKEQNVVKEPLESKEIKENKPLEATNELDEMKLTLQRLQAEFENYQKRTQREGEQFRAIANAALVYDLLPVLDTLEQGVLHNKEFASVQEQLIGILKKKGLEKIHAEKGKEFDHEKMDCLMEEECDGVKEGKIAKVLINGYTLNGKILRPTKVSIAKAKSNGEKHGNESGNELQK